MSAYKLTGYLLPNLLRLRLLSFGFRRLGKLATFALAHLVGLGRFMERYHGISCVGSTSGG